MHSEMTMDSAGEEPGPIKIKAKPSPGTQLHGKKSTDIVFPGRSSSQRHRKLINAISSADPIWQFKGLMHKRLKANENSKACCFCAAGRFSSFHSFFKEL